MTFEFILQWVVVASWLLWLLYWLISGLNVKSTCWMEPWWSMALHRLPMLVAALLVAVPKLWPAPLRERFLPEGIAGPIVGALLVVAGLGFSAWARFHLGRNWSSNVTLKEGHKLIRTGPYRFVRHPIYSGILLAFLGLAVFFAEWRALLALVLATAAFMWKSRRQEDRMQATFPEYAQYRRQTAAIVPFIF